jgi:hypothetical protein
MEHPLLTQRPKRSRNCKFGNKNISLLSKWIFNLLNEDRSWQSLLINKYITTKILSQVQAEPNDSHFWNGLLKFKKKVLDCGTFNIKDVLQIRF